MDGTNVGGGAYNADDDDGDDTMGVIGSWGEVLLSALASLVDASDTFAMDALRGCGSAAAAAPYSPSQAASKETARRAVARKATAIIPQDPDRFRKNRKNKAVSCSVTNRVKSSNVGRKARIVARESTDPVAFFVTLMDPNAGRMALPI